MPLLIGFLLVLLAALLQGTFVLPMTLVRQWSWEHTWATFSLLGMLVFNWIITLLLVPNIFAVYSASPARDLADPGALRTGLGSRRRPVRPGDGTAWHGPGISHHHGAYRQPGRADSAAGVFSADSFHEQRPDSARRNRAGHLRHRAVLHCRIPPHAFRRQVHRNTVKRFQDRPGHRNLRRHTLLPAQRGRGIRGKRDPGCRVAGRVPGFFREYGVGSAVSLWDASRTSHIACT